QVPADEGAAEVEEGIVELRMALIADEQAAVGMQPGAVALDHPAGAPQPLARLAAFAGEARGDAPAAEQGPVATGGVTEIGGQLVGPPARPAWAAVGRLEWRD